MKLSIDSNGVVSCPDCGKPMKLISGIQGVRLIRCEDCGTVVNLISLRIIPAKLFQDYGSQHLKEAVGQ